MTDKEIQEWEEECKEAEKDVRHLGRIVIITITILGILKLITIL